MFRMERCRKKSMYFRSLGFLVVLLFIAECSVAATSLSLLTEPREPIKPESVERTELPAESAIDASQHLHHRIMVANTVLQKLLLQNHNRDKAKMLKVLGPKETLYHDGETIATVHTDIHGNVTRCSLFEIKRLEDIDRTVAQFAQQNKPVQKITFRTMLDVITACQAIDPALVNVKPTFNTNQTLTENQPIDLTHMRSLISGILPGTKWCGLGDIAQDYEDLGMEKDLDKCCRAHDHCPTKLKSFRRGYGLINWSLYTKSHCECDSLLYECLKSAGTPTSDMLGNFYFNILQVQCIDEEQPVRCLTREKVTNACRQWVPDSSSNEKRLVFRDVRRQF